MNLKSHCVTRQFLPRSRLIDQPRVSALRPPKFVPPHGVHQVRHGGRRRPAELKRADAAGDADGGQWRN
jgi:hypothetical protein